MAASSGKGVTDIRVCVSAATLPNVPTTFAKTSWDAWQGMFDNLPGTLVGQCQCVRGVGVIKVRRSFTAAAPFCRRPSQSAR